MISGRTPRWKISRPAHFEQGLPRPFARPRLHPDPHRFLGSAHEPSSLVIHRPVSGGHSTTGTGATVGNVFIDNPEFWVQTGVKSLSITKTPTPTTYKQVGDTISYSYVVTNTGDARLVAPYTVTDDKTTVTCPATPTFLAATDETSGTKSVTCTATYSITLADLKAGKVTNTASAKANDAGNNAVSSSNVQATVTGPTAVLDKTWGVGGRPSDAVSLAISATTISNAVAGSSVLVGSTPSTTLATATASGTVTLTETFTTGSVANYTATIACTNSTGATVTPSAVAVSTTNNTASATYTAGSGTTYCQFTNTRKTATLQLAKAWSGGSKAGDTANIGATSSDGNSANTTSFTAAAGTAASSNTVTVYAGDTITLPAETMTPAADLGLYSTALACTNTTNALSGTNGQSSNTLLISPADAGKASVCTYTNKALPDLTITKTHSGTWRQGATGQTYTLTVTNSGIGSTSAAVSVTDTLPAGLTATAMSGTGWTCTLETLTCTRSDVLAAGSSYPAITVTVNVASNAAASLTNTASVSGGGESNTSNNSASDPTTISPPLPTITKSYSPTSIPADSTTTSTLTLTLGNTGSTAQTLTSALNDNIGANLTITSVSGGTCAAASTSFSGTTVTYASGATIPAGGCTILVTVKSGTSGSYPNTIAAGALVTNAGSNAAATSATLTVTPAADLSISKTGPSTATSGTQITYVLTLSNAGPNAANGATFSDNVNNTFTGVTASCLNPTGGVSGCVATVGSGNNVTGSVGTFPSGGSVQIQITGTIPAGATANLTNTATITVPSGVTEINTGNNTSQTVTTTLNKSAALSVTKTDGQTNVIKGQSLTYIIVVSNDGPSSTQLTFNDNTFSGVTLSNWACSVTAGTASCPSGLPVSGGYSDSLLNLSAGSVLTFTVTGTVTASSGTVSNTATITPATGVTDTTGTADNTATDTDTVIAAPQAQNDTGSTAVITPVTVNVLSNDTGTNLAASSVIFPAAGQPSGNTISNGGKTLVVAGQGQYDVQADGSIKFTPAAGFVGTASPVTYQVADAYGQTTTATLTITVSGTPALSIAKAVDTAYLRVTDDPNSQGTAALPASALSASTLTYTITVQNTGSVAATGVLLTDTLPAGLSFVSATNATSVVGGTYGTPATIVNTGSGQNLSFNVGTLNATEPAKSAQIVIKASVVLNANTNQSALLNTASASATGVSAVTSNQVRTDIIYPKLTKTVQNITKGTPASTALGGGLPSEKLEYCLNYFNYGSVALPAYTLTDQVPATTSALLGAYDSVVGGTVTGYGLKLTQGGTTTYLTSSADADGGQLTSSGGGFGSSTLTLKLGNLPAGASGSACFQVTIR
ncbi:beta strand repeat-containing protein [Deinococcus xinjiangensis]|uniref:beta strand repeat-containing protein n=1 Tax=Deinococcus xinjiangensis TaxID=457454 RepID=UPI003EB6DE22